MAKRIKRTDKNYFAVEWSSSHLGNLCRGEWSLFWGKDSFTGEDISYLIPEEIRREPMYTYGTYNTIWSRYIDGMRERDWIKENNYWLNEITRSYYLKKQLFKLFQQEDWRYEECGSCMYRSN